MTWRLTSELIAFFVTGEFNVYLSAVEKKKYIADTIKMITKPFEEKRLYENQFKLKLICDELGTTQICIKSDEFPTDNWYVVKNFTRQGLKELIQTHTITNGLFPQDVLFEVCFNDIDSYVSFTEPKMDNFKSCFEEMRRRINCELHKKSIKWIPGHRYDSETETIYYLGTVRSRKMNDFNSDFYPLDSDKIVKAYLYVNTLNDTDTSVNDVLRTRAIGEDKDDIKIAYKTSMMVDSGEAIKDDFSGNIQEYWLDIFENTCKKGHPLKDILKSFALIGSDTSKCIDTLPINKISELTKEVFFNIILHYWEIKSLREDLTVGDSIDMADNKKRLVKLLTASELGIKDSNFQKYVYYKNLYGFLKIDLDILAEEAINEFKSLDFLHNFDEYYKYKAFFENQFRYTEPYSRQRVESTNYKLDVITVNSLFGDTELTQTVLDCVNSVRSNFGIGVSEYNIINVGGKKSPKEYVYCKVTLDDLIKFKKGIQNMSETLKNDIMNSRFTRIYLEFDKNAKLS